MILDFKLSLRFECHMFSVGLFPGIWSLNANVLEHSVCSIFIGESVQLRTNSHTKMEQTECSKMLAFKLQTPGNNPTENMSSYDVGKQQHY
jgi:hypothetical protein